MIPDHLLSVSDDAAQCHDALRGKSDSAQHAIDEHIFAIRIKTRRGMRGLTLDTPMGTLPLDVQRTFSRVRDDLNTGNLVVAYLRRSYDGNNAGSVLVISETLAHTLIDLGWIRPATAKEWETAQHGEPIRERVDTCRGLRVARCIHGQGQFLSRQAA